MIKILCGFYFNITMKDPQPEKGEYKDKFNPIFPMHGQSSISVGHKKGYWSIVTRIGHNIK